MVLSSASGPGVRSEHRIAVLAEAWLLHGGGGDVHHRLAATLMQRRDYLRPTLLDA